MKSKVLVVILAILVFIPVCSSTSSAAGYPDRNIQLITPTCPVPRGISRRGC